MTGAGCKRAGEQPSKPISLAKGTVQGFGYGANCLFISSTGGADYGHPCRFWCLFRLDSAGPLNRATYIA